jgi:hypothetical protein
MKKPKVPGGIGVFTAETLQPTDEILKANNIKLQETLHHL